MIARIRGLSRTIESFITVNRPQMDGEKNEDTYAATSLVKTPLTYVRGSVRLVRRCGRGRVIIPPYPAANESSDIYNDHQPSSADARWHSPDILIISLSGTTLFVMHSNRSLEWIVFKPA